MEYTDGSLFPVCEKMPDVTEYFFFFGGRLFPPFSSFPRHTTKEVTIEQITS